MSTPTVRITLDSPTAHYQPGDRVTGRFMMEGMHGAPARAAELSVLWYTSGKGEEDMAVHHFERLVEDPAKSLDLHVPHRFATVLPESPLSYDGQIVKICWCVRVRLFLPQGQETVAETEFRLGSVPAANSEPPDDGVEEAVANGEA
jgi:hypothetical protein